MKGIHYKFDVREVVLDASRFSEFLRGVASDAQMTTPTGQWFSVEPTGRGNFRVTFKADEVPGYLKSSARKPKKPKMSEEAVAELDRAAEVLDEVETVADGGEPGDLVEFGSYGASTIVAMLEDPHYYDAVKQVQLAKLV